MESVLELYVLLSVRVCYSGDEPLNATQKLFVTFQAANVHMALRATRLHKPNASAYVNCVGLGRARTEKLKKTENSGSGWATST